MAIIYVLRAEKLLTVARSFRYVPERVAETFRESGHHEFRAAAIKDIVPDWEGSNLETNYGEPCCYVQITFLHKTDGEWVKMSGQIRFRELYVPNKEPEMMIEGIC